MVSSNRSVADVLSVWCSAVLSICAGIAINTVEDF